MGPCTCVWGLELMLWLEQSSSIPVLLLPKVKDHLDAGGFSY